MFFKTDQALRADGLLFALFGLLLVFLFSNPVIAQDQQTCRDFLKILNEKHYSPPVLDDQLSERISNQFLYALDPQKRLLLDGEVKSLQQSSLLIDDEFRGTASWKYLDNATIVYQAALQRTIKLLDELSRSTVQLQTKEFIKTGEWEDLRYQSDLTGLKDLWRKKIKSNMLHQRFYQDTTKANEQVAKWNEAKAILHFTELEKRKLQRITDHPEGFKTYVLNLFKNAMATSFDPHTIYLSAADRASFESGISEEDYTFGFSVVQTETGDLEVDHILPGGPAWKSNELHKGDRLISVRWEGAKTQNLAGEDVATMEKILSASLDKKLFLTVSPVPGISKTVVLMKEKVRNEEDLVKSFILDGEIKVGYIYLPGFYSDWENQESGGCANDVAKEILKLKEEGIQGLILDIRNNGGGSLVEGLQLAGLFINEGPMFLMKDKAGQITVMKDLNRGTVYDGPLTLMVNGGSASASEIIAGTLQDYGRAVIAGTRTFGKATCQTLMSVENKIKKTVNKTTSKAEGSCAVTIQKLYRVTGKSAQLKGVVPDVYLPEIIEKVYPKESDYAYCLRLDSVDKKVNYNYLTTLPFEELKSNSQKRLMREEWYALVSSYRDSIALQFKPEQTELSFSAIQKKEGFYSRIRNLESKVSMPATNYQVKNTLYEIHLYEVDVYGKEINELVKEGVQKDPYVQECYQLTKDIIAIKQKNK